MLYFLGRSVWLLWCWLELTVFTLVLYALSWLPRPLTRTYYHTLFLHWCKFFVRALGVNLRLHQKNLKPLPKQYILIANHPSALEDVGKHESCGQCTPCRVGTAKAARLLDAPAWDRSLLADLAQATADGSICGLGQAAMNPVRSLLRFFPEQVP